MTTPRFRGSAACSVMAAALSLAGGVAADEGCEDVRVIGGPSLNIAEPYDPFAPTDLTEINTVSIANMGEETCALAVAFVAPNGGQLRNASDSLGYSLETLDGAALLNPPSLADPDTGNHIDLALAGGQTAGISVRVRVTAQQMAAPGAYEDRAAGLRLFRTSGHGLPVELGQTPVPVGIEVAAVCRLTPPQPGTLDLSDDIGADARPAGGWYAVQLPEAACNTGARLEMSAGALARPESEGAAGLDDFIDFEALADFRGTRTVLLTNGADPPTEAYSTLVAQDGAPSPIRLHLRLRPSGPLAPGDYRSELIIALEPSS